MVLNEIAGPIIKSKWLTPEQKQYVLQHCKPFLEMIDYDLDTYTLYRGMDNASLSRGEEVAPGMTIKPGHVKSRTPLGTPIDVYNEVNDLFTKKFGVPFRNSVFTTGDYAWGHMFGIPHMIIPIGNFKFCWSPTIRDFGEHIMDEGSYDILKNKNKNPHAIQQWVQSIVDEHIDTDLKRAIRSHHEIAIYCDKCLIISSHSKELGFGIQENNGGLFAHAKTYGLIISDVAKSLTPEDGISFIENLSYNGYSDWSIMTQSELNLHTNFMLNPKIQSTKYYIKPAQRIVYNTNESNTKNPPINDLEAYVQLRKERSLQLEEEYIFIPVRRVPL